MPKLPSLAVGFQRAQALMKDTQERVTRLIAATSCRHPFVLQQGSRAGVLVETGEGDEKHTDEVQVTGSNRGSGSRADQVAVMSWYQSVISPHRIGQMMTDDVGAKAEEVSDSDDDECRQHEILAGMPREQQVGDLAVDEREQLSLPAQTATLEIEGGC